jgi:predicted nucleic acid-binding protein
MNIYCETNFILEIVFSQEQATYCENIISLCKENKVNLIIPAYSFAEAIYRRENQISLQKSLIEDLSTHFKHFSRTIKYNQQNEQQIQKFKDLERFLLQNNNELTSRFETCRDDLVNNSKIISLDKDILISAKYLKSEHDLTFQDSIVFASILTHLEQNNLTISRFLTRDGAFSSQEIRAKLKSLNCDSIPSFEDGFSFISSQIK